MSREIELWQSVVEDAALLERAVAVDPSDVTAVAALRRGASLDEVTVALELTQARAKAAVKFGEASAGMVADVQGVEQASGAAVGLYKASRINAALGQGTSVADLCCGIGGDSMALASTGRGVISVDRDPLRAWMAGRNTHHQAQAVCADVADLSLGGMAIHIDPARRSEATGKRFWRLDDYQPGPATIGKLIQQALAGAVKLSPGVDLDELPWPGEVEFISEGGRLVQVVLWSGAFAQVSRRATRIDHQGTHHLSGEPLVPPIDLAQRYLYTFDAAVERADLIGHLSSLIDAPAIHPKLGLLTSDRVIESPWVTGFELIERLPWRPKRVKQWLATNDGGLVEVKTRGKACDPDPTQRQLRGDGGTAYTVFVLRFDTKVQALVTRRLMLR